VATTLVVGSLSLLPLLGKGALGGLGLLGLLGLDPLFFRMQKGQVVTDEWDLLINRRAWVLAYSLFWVPLPSWPSTPEAPRMPPNRPRLFLAAAPQATT
jgi:hypothetical protein